VGFTRGDYNTWGDKMREARAKRESKKESKK
jgi:hypothetical protein